MLEREFTLFPERGEQRRSALYRFESSAGEITGGSPYGASTIANSDYHGDRQPSANELDGARYQGQHVARIAAKLAA